MEKTKMKVINSTIGKYDYDTITVLLDGAKTEICFDKKENVSQYNGTEIYLSKNKGAFVISKIETLKK